MKKISLNFFGEKAEINVPTSLDSLRKAISDQFLFSPRDAAELVVFYVKDLGRKVVETQKDFVEFLKAQPKELNLDISEQSHLYQENIKSVVAEETKKEELERLQNEKKAIVEACSKRMKDDKTKIASIKANINALKKQYLDLNKAMLDDFKKTTEQIKPMKQRIRELEKDLGVEKPKDEEKKGKTLVSKINLFANKIEKKMNKMLKKENYKVEKKNIKKEKKLKKEAKKHELKQEKKEEPKVIPVQQNFQDKIVAGLCDIKEYILDNGNKIKDNISNKLQGFKAPAEGVAVHNRIICDGCGMNPIVGPRFKCAICEDFDYCAKCEEAFSKIHQHPFIKINKPEQAPTSIKCVIGENFPTFQKQI